VVDRGPVGACEVRRTVGRAVVPFGGDPEQFGEELVVAVDRGHVVGSGTQDFVGAEAPTPAAAKAVPMIAPRSWS